MKQEFSDEWEMRMGIKWEMRLGIHVERWHLQNSPTFHISRYLKVLADNSFAERSLLYISITDRYNKRYMTRWNWQCYLRPTNVSQVLVVVTNKSIPSTDTKYAWEKLNSELEMHWGFMSSLWFVIHPYLHFTECLLSANDMNKGAYVRTKRRHIPFNGTR